MPLQIFDLSNKVAMVTGSTRGLGEVSAKALAKADADIAVCGRNTDDLKRVSGAIRELGRDSEGFVLDVTSRQSVHDGVTRILKHFGKADILVNQVAYASAKGGVDQMTKVMAVEWAKQGVRVNAIGPTYFETDMVKQIREDPERFNFINERTPMGRWGYLPELEGIVIFLAARASDFITGQTLYIDGIDGGWTAW